MDTVEAEGLDSSRSGHEEAPPDDEHEHVEVPKLPRTSAHTLTAPSALGNVPKSKPWAGQLLPGKFDFGCSPSEGYCGSGEDGEGVDGATAWVVPLPAVALEGPPELPKSATVAVQSLGGPKKRSNASMLVMPASPTATAAVASVVPSLASTPVSPDSGRKGTDMSSPRASPRQRKAENSNQRTLKFYPQPSDDRSGVSVDVIEHGYEVLIVRREASPSPRCPPILTEPPEESKAGTDGADEEGSQQRGTGSSNAMSWVQRTPDSGKEDVSI